MDLRDLAPFVYTGSRIRQRRGEAVSGAYDGRCYRLLLQIQGTSQIAGHGGPWALRPGRCALIEPGVTVRSSSAGSAIRVVCDLVARPRSVRRGIAYAADAVPQPELAIVCGRAVTPLVPEHLTRDAANCMHRLALMRPADPRSVCESNRDLHDLLTPWLNTDSEGTASVPRQLDLISAVEALIVAQATSGVSIADIAAQLGRHPNHVTTCYSRHRGHGPSRFLALERLRHAQHHLATSDKTISTIAEDCGYGHANSLRRAFRQFLGCTPQDWRRRQNHPQRSIRTRHAAEELMLPHHPLAPAF